MKHPQMKVTTREVLGKKIKKLRREGILPANIYGKELASLAVQVPYTEFQSIYNEVKQTGLVDVEVDGNTRPVLIKNIQVDHINNKILHADLYQVNLKEKITSMVPVVVTGEPKAVTEKIGLLMQPVSEIEVEALPEDLPESFEINVEPLAAIDEQITVGDLKAAKGVTILTDPAQVVVKIAELVSEEAKEDAAAAEAASEEAKDETEGEAGVETPQEGEETKEQTAKDEKKEE